MKLGSSSQRLTENKSGSLRVKPSLDRLKKQPSLFLVPYVPHCYPVVQIRNADVTHWTCQTAATGRLSLELSQLRFSRIIFQYSHRPISAQNLAPDPRLAPTTSTMEQPYILLGQDFQAVQVEIESPETSQSTRTVPRCGLAKADTTTTLQFISIVNARFSYA